MSTTMDRLETTLRDVMTRLAERDMMDEFSRPGPAEEFERELGAMVMLSADRELLEAIAGKLRLAAQLLEFRAAEMRRPVLEQPAHPTPKRKRGRPASRANGTAAATPPPMFPDSPAQPIPGASE